MKKEEYKNSNNARPLGSPRWSGKSFLITSEKAWINMRGITHRAIHGTALDGSFTVPSKPDAPARHTSVSVELWQEEMARKWMQSQGMIR
jgi:hypothetical protein